MRKENMVGNDNLSSNEDSRVAEFLRDNYLEKTNRESAPVYPRNTFYTRIGKRILDILISFPTFIVLLPLNIILGICTFFDVGSPIFYKQTRIGMDGKKFILVKFRNMNNKTDADGKLLPPSQRVTKFGKFMRRLSLDELLNFWSILKGDMSVIGPRPMPAFLYDRLSDRHKMRSAIRPGLECPRVIKVKNGEQFRYQRTYENDIWYVENVSFFVDIKLCFMLVKMVFSSERKKQADGKGITYFVGYNEDGIAMSLLNYKRTMENQKAVAEGSEIAEAK